METTLPCQTTTTTKSATFTQQMHPKIYLVKITAAKLEVLIGSMTTWASPLLARMEIVSSMICQISKLTEDVMVKKISQSNFTHSILQASKMWLMLINQACLI